MTADEQKSRLAIRVRGHLFVPSPSDTEKIREAVGVVAEILESLIQIASDDRTIAALLSDGNGQAHGPTPADLQEIAQALHEGLTMLHGNELDFDGLEAAASDLDGYARAARQSFEARSQEFTPRAIDEAGPLNVTGALFAGLSDAADAIEQLLGLLREIIQQAGGGHGRA